jgi:hypothetical protein
MRATCSVFLVLTALVRTLLSLGVLRRLVWYKYTDVSEECTISIFRICHAIRLHGVTSQKMESFKGCEAISHRATTPEVTAN